MIRAELMHFVGAAVVPTSICLSYVFWEFSKSSELMQKVKEEVDKYCPNPAVTFEQLSSAKYLKMVSLESKRRFTQHSVPFVLGRVEKPLHCEGYVVPSGWRAVACYSTICHDPKIWTNPNQFDPMRFDESRREDKNPYSFVPLGVTHGVDMNKAHGCAGYEMADLLIELFFVHLLRGSNPFKWSLVPKQQLNIVLDTLPQTPADGLLVENFSRGQK